LAWTIRIKKTAEKQILKLETHIKRRIVDFLKNKLSTSNDPKQYGRKLSGNKGDLWRYRIGNYRLICQINSEELIILVLVAGHRKDIYKK
jgi:mRNA interferase RelE/StbE